jgi:cytochrome c oxidase subunit 2
MNRREVLSGGAAVGVSLLAGSAVRVLGAPAERVIAIVARKFVFIPAEVSVRRGEPVVLELSAPEVAMGFFAPALGLRALIVPGEIAHVRWTPDRAGRFDFLCDVFCGDGHEGMNGHLVVV